MSVVTFLPTLIALGEKLCNFIHDHEEALRDLLGEEDEALLDAALVACSALTVAIKLLVPPKT